jgi:hypothetical protein
VSQNLRPTVHVHAASDAGTPVVIGVPFKPGEVRDGKSLSVNGPDGKPTLAGCRTLVTWPDGSTRWALASFLATQRGAHAVEPGTPSQPGVKLTRSGDTTVLENDHVKATLATAGPVLRIATPKGDAVVSLIVDDADASRDAQRKITVLEENPARVRIRLEGGHLQISGGRKLSYRLDAELWANQQALRLDYHFFNLEPGQDFLDIGRIAVELALPMDAGKTQRHLLQENRGIFYQPHEVLNPAPVAIVSDNERIAPRAEKQAMLLDDEKYPFYVDLPLVDTSGWLGVTDGDLHAYLTMQDLIQMKPKRLASEGNKLALEVWPASAGTLKLQQGWSRRQVITVAIEQGPRPNAAQIQSMLTTPHWEGRATVDPDWLARCGEYEQDKVLPYAKHGRFEKFLGRVVSVEMAADMFDLGDTPDAGYSRSYTGIGVHRSRPVEGAPPIKRVLGANWGLAAWWPLDLQERVWVNNEYDGIHTYACELMRTGKPGLWQTLRWMVRHNIEVDFLHYSDHKWLHRASPVHSARHSTSGAYPSHFWTQGLMEYYCLTGDPDVLEVAVALGDCILLHFHDPERGRFYRNFDRELGWALLALVHVWDITREKRFQDEIDRLCEFFMKGQQADNTSTTAFKGQGKPSSLLNPTVVAAFYFMLNLVEAMDLYQTRTGRKDIAQYLDDLLGAMPDAVQANFRRGMTSYSTAAALAIGYERSQDKRFLKAGLVRVEELITEDPRWLNPIPEIKPMAVLYREFVRYLGHAYRAGLLDEFEYEHLTKA